MTDIIRQETLIPWPERAEFIPVVDKDEAFMGILSKDGLRLVRQMGIQASEALESVLDRQIPCIFVDRELTSLPPDFYRGVVLDREQHIIGIVNSKDYAPQVSHYWQEKLKKFFAVINSAKNGILAIDNQGKILIANPVVEQMVGKSRAELLGADVRKVIPGTRLLEIVESGKALLGQRFVFPTYSVITNYAPIMVDNHVMGAVSIFQDISIVEDISMELDYVKGLMQELEAIINSSYDGMFITDGQGVVLRINQAYEDITGIKLNEIIGKNMKGLVEVGYYDQSVSLLVMEQQKSLTINQTVKGDRKILVTGNPIFDKQGNLFRVVTNVRDITKLVNLQEQLVKTQEQTLKYKTELSHLRSMQMQGHEIIFRSRAMAQVVELAIKVADVNSTILITGESGTGKELIAKLIHKKGIGVAKPLIKINCAAIPEQLLESELFGYEGGAFTGAKKEGKPGLFELAHNGTLFLDEIGDIPLVLQAKLLRAIQEKEIVRVGGTKPITFNVRIIAATHRDLVQMVKENKFRQDLYYRLVVVPITIPPLRERKDDILVLVMHFLDKINQRFGFQKKISSSLLDKLLDYSWPGNVRELENLIERMIVTSIKDEITPEQLPDYINKEHFMPRKGSKLKEAVEQVEIQLMTEAFKEYSSWAKVADVLGVDRSTIFRKANKYGIDGS
jgi:PAS domain S-box-containing protein